MAITPRASTTLAYGTRTTTTATRPTGTTTGDYIVVALDVGGSTAATITPPSGWTQIGTVTFSDTSPAWSVVLQIWGRFDDGAASWSWTHASRETQAYATAYIGVHQTTPIDVAATTAAINNVTAGSTIDAPSYTIVTAGARGIIARGSWDGNAITPPSGWSERLDTPVLWVGDRDWSPVGATGAVTVNAGNSGASPRGVIMAALRPAGTSIPSGTGTGTYTFTGAGTGKRTPQASGTGSYTFTGTAAGARTPKGSGTGTVTVTGTATGHRASLGTATGSYMYTGEATGQQQPTGTGTGTVSFTGTAQGHRSPEATGTGTYLFTGAATGTAPGSAEGSGTGTYSYTGTAIGGRASLGQGTGTTTWTGTATGVRHAQATAAGTFSWSGTATGHRTPEGAAVGDYHWTGTAVGDTPDGIPSGTGTGTIHWSSQAQGQRHPVATGTGTYGWTGTAHTPGEDTGPIVITTTRLWEGTATLTVYTVYTERAWEVHGELP